MLGPQTEIDREMYVCSTAVTFGEVYAGDTSFSRGQGFSWRLDCGGRLLDKFDLPGCRLIELSLSWRQRISPCISLVSCICLVWVEEACINGSVSDPWWPEVVLEWRSTTTHRVWDPKCFHRESNVDGHSARGRRVQSKTFMLAYHQVQLVSTVVHWTT